MTQTPDSYYVGEWLVEPSLMRLSRNGVSKKLEPQMMAVLLYLVTHEGEVVRKENLLESVWVDVVVTDNVLTRAISALRKALEDDRRQPIYIETISKVGYRLIAPVEQRRDHISPKNLIQKTPTVLLMLGALGMCILLALTSGRVYFKKAPKNYQPTVLANYTNTEYWPDISTDGKFVAYSWKGKQDDNWDIYVRQIGVEGEMKITESPATELRAEWSADGQYVYFLRYGEGGVIYKKSLVGEKEIRVMEAPKYNSGDFDISPDNQWVSFNDRVDRGSPLRILLISMETGENRWLTQPEDGLNGDIHPTFSPDGKKIAFIRERHSASMQLWVLNLDTEELTEITTNHVSINGFDWMPDGQSLIYGSNQTGLYKLWEVDVPTRKSQLLMVSDEQMVMPRVAENGRIIYAKMKDNVNIWSFDLQKESTQPWLSTNTLSLNPVVSPDASLLCYTQKKNGVFQIWTSQLDGSEARPISQFKGQHLSAPRWMPDGKEVVFHGFSDGQMHIYKVHAEGGTPEKLTHGTTNNETPFPSAEGDIYISSDREGEWGIWKLDEEGNWQSIIGDNAYAPQLNPSGELLYYVKKDAYGLWEFDLQKGEERKIIEAFHPMHWGAFSVLEDGLYYLNAQNRQCEFYDFQSGESIPVFKPEKRIPRMGISLHTVGEFGRLMYTQIDENDADIMMLEED